VRQWRRKLDDGSDIPDVSWRTIGLCVGYGVMISVFLLLLF
jgi:uncharacterized protein YjeT (DUF2065 family)